MAELLSLKKTSLNSLNDLWRMSASSVELAKARLGSGTNFSFHISGFVVKLTNPFSTERPPKQQE